MLNKNQLHAIDHAIEIHLIAEGVDYVIYMDMGEKLSIHFSKVTSDTLLVSMFNREISLGMVRLKVDAAIEEISRVLVGVTL